MPTVYPVAERLEKSNALIYRRNESLWIFLPDHTAGLYFCIHTQSRVTLDIMEEQA